VVYFYPLLNGGSWPPRGTLEHKSGRACSVEVRPHANTAEAGVTQTVFWSYYVFSVVIEHYRVLLLVRVAATVVMGTLCK
jgi:hypothetical protein